MSDLFRIVIRKTKRTQPTGEHKHRRKTNGEHKTVETIGEQTQRRRKQYWMLWVELLKHTFQVDVKCCPICHHSMQLIAELHTPEGILGLLSYDELARPPP